MACPRILKEGVRSASLPRKEVAVGETGVENERKREKERERKWGEREKSEMYIYKRERQFTGLSSQVMLLRVPKTPIFARYIASRSIPRELPRELLEMLGAEHNRG